MTNGLENFIASSQPHSDAYMHSCVSVCVCAWELAQSTCASISRKNLTSKDLKEDEASTSRAHGEASQGVDDHGLTHVSKEEHQHCAHQKAEEHAMAEARPDLIRKNIKLCTNGIRRALAQRRVGSKA